MGGASYGAGMSAKHELMRKFQQLQDRIHALMEEAAVGSHTHRAGLPMHWAPAVDVYETEDAFVLTAEIPGVEQKEVDVQIRDNILILKGHCTACAESPKTKYYRLERPPGSFERRFSLPEETEAERVRANLGEGVLTVTLPKKQQRPQPRRVPVKQG